MITLIKKLYQFGQNYLFAHQMKKIKLFLFFTLKEEQKHYTVIHIEMYRITGRSFLKNNYLSSFIQFESCCGVCWCCKRLKKILDEFEKKKDLICLIHIFNVGKFTKILIILKSCQYLRTISKKKTFFSFLEKMANTLSIEIPLKFTKNDFHAQSTPDLLINVWSYNYYKPHC